MLGQHRSTQRRIPRGRDDEDRLVADMIELARQYGRYGYRRIAALLRDAGWQVNDKRALRLWRREGLVCQANWQKAGGESPLERRNNQTTFLREPCVGSREGADEASVAVRVGRAIEHRKSDGPGRRGFQSGRRQHRRHRVW